MQADRRRTGVSCLLATFLHSKMAVNLDENNLQSSQLGEDDIRRMEEETKPQNSYEKQTALGIEKFNDSCTRRKADCNLNTVSPTKLSGVLQRFYAEVKSNEKKDLTPSALTGIRAAIHRTITRLPISRPVNILQDKEFLPACKMFEAVSKSYYKKGNPKPQHKSPIEPDTEP